MTEGSAVKPVLMFAGPIAVGSLFQSLYNTMDSVIVGRFLGAQALAAVGSTAQVTHLFLLVTMGFTGAFSILVSQYIGAKREDMVRKTIAASLYMVLFGGLILGVIANFVARPVMQLMQADPMILDDAALYLRICLVFCFGQIAYNVVSSILRAIGDSRTPLYFLILSSVLNIVLNILFVAAFHMGVAGVAIATVIAQILSAAACMIYSWWKYPVFRLTAADMRPGKQLILESTRLGMSIGSQQFLTTMGDTVIAARINSFGVATVTAYTAVSQIMRFATMLFSSISQAFSVYAGQNYGANKMDRIRTGFRKNLVIDLALSAAGAAVMLLFGRSFISVYLSASDPHFDTVMAMAREYQIISSLCYPFLALIWMYNQTLRGVGKALVPLAGGIIEIVFKLTGALVLSAFIGATGLWLASPIGWIAGSIPGMIYYHSGKWEKQPGPEH